MNLNSILDRHDFHEHGDSADHWGGISTRSARSAYRMRMLSWILRIYCGFGGMQAYGEAGEQARKTGPSMRLLGQALVAVSESQIESVCGFQANIACCAYVIDTKDENGHRLSHQLRVRSAIEKEAQRDVNITWIACTVRRNGLVEMKTSAEIVEASLPSRILARLNGVGWTFANEQWVVQYGHHKVSIWSGEDEGSDEILWYFKVDESESGWAESLTAAKRAAAAVLGNMPAV